MKSQAARARSTAGLWLLACALERIGLEADRTAQIGLSGHGRPQLIGGPAFSISHSRTVVACAIDAHHNVGLDVEARRQRVSPRLRQRLSSAPCAWTDNSDRFFDDWCAREATVKASGRVGLARIRAVELDQPARARLDEQTWYLRPLPLATAYAACLASDRPIGNVNCLRLSPPDRA